jgi:hypothetical protein
MMSYARSQKPVIPVEPEPLALRQLEGKWLAVSPYQVWQQIELQAGKISVKVKGQPSLRGYFSLQGQQLEVTLTSGVASGRTIEFSTGYQVSEQALALEFSVSSFQFQRGT